MKRLLLALCCVFATVVFADSKVYTEQLVVTINGESSAPQMTGVTVVDNGDQTINFELKNFFLSSAETDIPVGNIIMENIPVTKGADGLDYFTFDGSISIQPGDMEGVPMWMGPMFGEIPMKLQGKKNAEKLYVTIDIDMQEVMGQVVYVQLGSDFGDKESVIGGIQSKPATSSAVYSLSGHRVKNSQLKKGIYVVEGKKVLF
jgi:hypothetical protein